MNEFDLLWSDDEMQFAREESYQQGRTDAIEELSNALCEELDKGYIFMSKHQILHFAKQIKEQK